MNKAITVLTKLYLHQYHVLRVIIVQAAQLTSPFIHAQVARSVMLRGFNMHPNALMYVSTVLDTSTHLLFSVHLDIFVQVSPLLRKKDFAVQVITAFMERRRLPL